MNNETKPIMVDPDPPHGYCYSCGKPFWFTSTGAKEREPRDAFTTPETERICDDCWASKNEEITRGEIILERVRGWLEVLQTLIYGWPEGGSMVRFQDVLWHLAQDQINNLQDPAKVKYIEIDPGSLISREKALLL